MAMDGARLGTAMFNAIEALGIDDSAPITNEQREDIWKAAGNAIVDELSVNGQILVTGVESGGATAPGTIS